ncbi:MAG: hypothetical protein FWC32_06225 [Firmicutes bacterium]|nr:hypothetical protein [Bacillota bacterium]
MTGKTERVVLVKGDTTKWYEQAIFIVNPNFSAAAMPVDFVTEAEKIINEYNLNGSSQKDAPKNHTSPVIIKARPMGCDDHKPSIVLAVLMILACVVITAVLAYGLLS